MTIIIKNAILPSDYGFGEEKVSVVIKDKTIAYVGTSPDEKIKADRVIDAKSNLLIPGFYNAHCHAAMTIFRGYGEDLPLHRWLNEKILPAEDRLNDKSVYYGAMIAIAEMLRSGTVSFSDMYMFENIVGDAVLETGIKANITRNLVSFDENADFTKDYRFLESVDLINKYNGAGDGKIIAEMSLHAEYSNVEKYCRFVGDYIRGNNLGVQFHLSETKGEHEDSIKRHGKTPLEFFNDAGVLDTRAYAAHCVWVSDDDIALMAKKKISAVHNPVSNLKLASGIMPIKKFADAGVNIAIGTDGAASNNSLNMIKELQYAALIHRGVSNNPLEVNSLDILKYATLGGAVAQGREKCGRIEEGFFADLVLIDLDSIHNIPHYIPEAALIYSADASDVKMTMVDGRILYENGEYTTIDAERLKYEAKEVFAHYFD